MSNGDTPTADTPTTEAEEEEAAAEEAAAYHILRAEELLEASDGASIEAGRERVWTAQAHATLAIAYMTLAERARAR